MLNKFNHVIIQKERSENMQIEWKTCFKVGLSAFILYLCTIHLNEVILVIKTLFSAAMPLVIGFVIFYLVNIVMSFYERKLSNRCPKKLCRPISLLAAIVSLIGVLALVIYLVVPELISCVKVVLEVWPDTIKNIVEELNNAHMLPTYITEMLNGIDWKSTLNQFMNIITSGVGSTVGAVVSTVSTVFSSIVTGVLSIIFAIYLLMGKDTLQRQTNRLAYHYLPIKWYERCCYVLSIINKSFHSYIVGQCTEAIILGGLCAVGMILLGLPYATMIGALIAFTALIPVAGGYIGAGVGAFMIFTVDPFQALVFLIYIVILQQIEGNLIYPKVVGDSIGLPGIWVLTAVTIGGALFGVLGMLLGVPLTAAIYRIIRNDLNKIK